MGQSLLFYFNKLSFSGHDLYEIIHEHLVVNLQIDVDILFSRFGADPEISDGGTLAEPCGQYFDVPSDRFPHVGVYHE